MMMVMLMKNIVLGMMIRTQTNMMLSKVDTAFKMFDKNKDGFITKEEFAQVWGCLILKGL